jgi:type I site-specific restriction endonuclease
MEETPKNNHNTTIKSVTGQNVYAYFFSTFTKKKEKLKLFIGSNKQYIIKKYIQDEIQVIHQVESSSKKKCALSPPQDYYCCKHEHEVTYTDTCAICKEIQAYLSHNNIDQLYPYQHNIVKALSQRASNCCLINIPTGYGKTHICLAYIYSNKLKSLIVVHNILMKEQWEKQIRKLEGVDIRVKCIQGINKKKEDSERGKYFSQFDCVIFDEVHMFMSKEFIKNIIACDSNHIIALSATPTCKFSNLGVDPFR